jgi:hypothetical protein
VDVWHVMLEAFAHTEFSSLLNAHLEHILMMEIHIVKKIATFAHKVMRAPILAQVHQQRFLANVVSLAQKVLLCLIRYHYLQANLKIALITQLRIALMEKLAMKDLIQNQ